MFPKEKVISIPWAGAYEKSLPMSRLSLLPRRLYQSAGWLAGLAQGFLACESEEAVAAVRCGVLRDDVVASSART